MATIYNTDTGEAIEVSLMADGIDMMADVIGNVAEREWLDAPDGCDYQMDTDNIEWWTDYARRQERINDALSALDLDRQDEIMALVDVYDMDVMQDKLEQLLGI